MRKYTIVVPVYNVNTYYFDECIKSLINQTYENVEVIIIDDGSNEEIYNYCDEMKKIDKRIRVFHKKNGGVSSARNYGIRFATGDYITFTDSDDYLSINTIEEIDKIISLNDDLDIVKFGFIRKSNIESIIKISTIQNICINRNAFSGYVYNNIYNTKDYESASNAFFKLDFIKKERILFDESIHVTEDFLFVMECISKANNIYFHNKHLYYYRINYESVSQKYDANKIISKIKDEIRSYKKVFSIIPECVVNKNFIDQYYKKLSKLIYNKLSLIALNENYDSYILKINNINLTKEYKDYLAFFKKDEISISVFYYLYLKINIILKKIVKKILGR